MNPTGPASAGIGTASPWRIRSPSSISAPTGYSYEIFIDRASRPSGGPATAWSSASSADSPTVAMIGFSPAGPGSTDEGRIDAADRACRLQHARQHLVEVDRPAELAQDPAAALVVGRPVGCRAQLLQHAVQPARQLLHHLLEAPLGRPALAAAGRRGRRPRARRECHRRWPSRGRRSREHARCRPFPCHHRSFRPPRRLSTRPRLTVVPHRRSRYGSKPRNHPLDRAFLAISCV